MILHAVFLVPTLGPQPLLASDMVLIPGGCFIMGCGDWTHSCEKDELPVREVCVEDFSMGAHEVTVGEYQAFFRETGYRADSYDYGGCFRWTGIRWEKDASLSWEDPGFPQTPDDPVVCISWKDAMRYIVWKSGRDGVRYRLPSEAEWEYAARNRGQKVAYPWSADSPADNIANASMRGDFMAWPWPFWKGYEDGYVYTSPFDAFPSSPIGLHGMAGNAAEWCFDAYDAEAYASGDLDVQPEGETTLARVVRGGSWLTSPRFSRAGDRRHSRPWGRSTHLGFRLASTPGER